MLQNLCLILFFLFIGESSSAQYYLLNGKITNNKLEPLPLVSIRVKEMNIGTVTKENGQYELRLEEGKYDLIITMIGYKSQVITVTINNKYTQNIILEADEGKSLAEVVIKGKSRDRSEEIIRNVIRNKDAIVAASGAYSLNAYIRATQEDSSSRKKKRKDPVPDSVKNVNEDLKRMSMAEITLHYDHETDNKIKEERTGVAKRGNPESLFYLSLTDGNFNLYNNLLVSVLSKVPFVSPISYSGLAAYRFKMISIKQQGPRKIYTIAVRPRQLSNVTVEGQVTIMDSSWVLLEAHFTLPKYHVPEYDFFEVNQNYSLIDGKAWMISRQYFRYFSKHGKGKLSGETIVNYQDFELQKTFPKKYFGNELSATRQEAYERDSSFWETRRTEPLTPKEIRFIQYRDSIHRVMTSKVYLDSLDRVTNRVTWKKIALFGQPIYSREKERTWVLPSALSLYQPFSFGGVRVSATGFYTKIYKSKKNLSVFTNLSYGIRNKDVNGSVRLIRRYNPFDNGFYRIEVGREFQYIFQGDAWINLLKRSNIYLNNSFGLGHGLELLNGLSLYTDLNFAFRRSVSDYKTNRQVDSLFGDILEDNQAIAFNSYNSVYGKVRLQYTPGQKYMREPREKIILGSKWPTFYTTWRKGIPKIFNSKADFDYLEFGMEQEIKLGTTGVSKYTLKTGSFLTKKDLRLVDYQFQRRGDPILFMNPNEAFQSLDSTFPIFKRFYQAHYLHEFNGAILNKIPFLKKLELREIGGGGFLYAPERNLRYGELFVGIERVFRVPFNNLGKFKLGVYLVGSAANHFNNPVQFKVGITSWDIRNNKWN